MLNLNGLHHSDWKGGCNAYTIRRESCCKNWSNSRNKVKVTKVNTSIIRGKAKSFKGSFGYKKDIKKAIVTLAEGNTIDSSLEIKWL